MSLPLVLGALWVIAASVTAMLPMRLQIYPGIPLLLAVPVLLVWIGMAHGIWWVVAGLLAFGSMFRRPLYYLFLRVTGRPIPDHLNRAVNGEDA